MKIYEKVKKISPEAKAEADAFISGLTRTHTEENPASPELIQQGLEQILAKYRAKIKEEHTTGKLDDLVGLAGILGATIAFAGGSYGLGLVGILAAYVASTRFIQAVQS